MKNALQKKYSWGFSTCCIIPFLLAENNEKTTGTILLQLVFSLCLSLPGANTVLSVLKINTVNQSSMFSGGP